jgi:hypothetical protein
MSPMLRSKSTCLKSFNKTSLMKKEMNVVDPIGIPQKFGPLEGVLNKVNRMKSLGKHDRVQTIHL